MRDLLPGKAQPGEDHLLDPRLERAAARGIPVRRFPHHDPATLQNLIEQDRHHGRRPVVVSDGFCPTCGVHLFSEAESRPHLIFVRAGTLDDPDAIRPAATIWTTQAPGWACIDASLPAFDGQPPPVA